MIPENVTLVVKAPNQQIEDQSVECQTSWTVKRLKEHLSDVYPSKPTIDEQKIIYSGQLLDDTSILKDVLRNYDDEIHHTMHLVCSMKRRAPEPPKVPQETEGLRHRVPTSTDNPPETIPRPELRQNDQNHTVEMQNYLNTFANNYGRVPPYPAHYGNFAEYASGAQDPAGVANQMMMMQQAYFNYMQHYANMWQATQNAAAAAPPPAAVAPPPPRQPAPDPAAAPAYNRDWLDQVYCVCRVCVLVSLVYVYSSPARLLLVTGLLAAAYWHYMGFFRNDNNAANRRNRQNAQQAQNNANNGPANANNGAENAQNAQNPPDNTDNANVITEAVNNNVIENDNQQSLLGVTITIFTSFFASLIPEVNQ